MKEININAICTIAEKAGNIILGYYMDINAVITYKSDESPLTIADLESDRYIKKALSERYGIPVLSEEEPFSYEHRKDWDLYFLVDPLDGTKEYIDRNGEFTVNIALIRNNKPVLGVIYSPVLSELYYAKEGVGAFLKKDGIINRLPYIEQNNTTLIATGSRKHSTDMDAEFYRLNKIEHIVAKGSSLKFCSVASGAATIYPRFQGSKEWDIAAGHIIAKESGCLIIDLVTGREPEYNKESLRNNYFIVCTGQVVLSSIRYPDSSTIPVRT